MTHKLARSAALAVVAGLALARPAAAQPAGPHPALQRPRGGEVSAQSVQGKLSMVDKLVFDSPVATRVVGSQNDDARRHFNDARELYTHARALHSTGQLRGADLLLNEAIWEIGRAQQLVPDQAARLVEERSRYQQLKSSADALLRTYQLGQPGAGATRADSAGDRSVAQAVAAVEQARTLADGGRVVDANRSLDQALSLLLKDALTRIDGKTLVYDRRFASTREEFAYEAERHRSFESLVPLAVLEFRPSREAQALIDRYLRQSKLLRERADAQAAANDHAGGIQTLVEGTDTLQRALQAAGLMVPQTMGAP